MATSTEEKGHGGCPKPEESSAGKGHGSSGSWAGFLITGWGRGPLVTLEGTEPKREHARSRRVTRLGDSVTWPRRNLALNCLDPNTNKT